MFKMTVTYEELSYLLNLIRKDITQARSIELEPSEEAFTLEVKLVAAGQVAP